MKASLFILLPLLLLVGCIPDNIHDFDFRENQPNPSEIPDPINYELVDEQTAGNVTVGLYAEGGWNAGYRPMRIDVKQNGDPVADASISVSGIARFADVERELPIEHPFEADDSNTGSYVGSIFLLGDRSDTPVELTFEIDINGQSHEVSFENALPEHPLAVRNIASDGLAVHGVWMHPRNAIVGRNTFEAALFYETSTGFEPLGGASVEIYPYMDMGGGDGHSTPFTRPEEYAVGRWHSEITFIMSGGWELSLYLDRSGAERDTLLFSPFIVFEL